MDDTTPLHVYSLSKEYEKTWRRRGWIVIIFGVLMLFAFIRNGDLKKNLEVVVWTMALILASPLGFWAHLWFIKENRVEVYKWGFKSISRFSMKSCGWEEIEHVDVRVQKHVVRNALFIPVASDVAFRVVLRCGDKLVFLNEQIGHLDKFLEDIARARRTNPPRTTGWSIL